jgi:hypothetical protein
MHSGTLADPPVPVPALSCSLSNEFSCRSSSISLRSSEIWASRGSYCTMGLLWMFLVRVA